MTTRNTLLDAIDNHLIARRISATKLCNEAKVDHHVIRKLRTGESISLKSIEKLEAIVKPVCPEKTEGRADVQ